MLNVSYLIICYIIEIHIFRNILPYESVSILYGTFLPGGVWIRKVHLDIRQRFASQSFGDIGVRGELASVIGRDCFYSGAPCEQHPDHSLGQRGCFRSPPLSPLRYMQSRPSHCVVKSQPCVSKVSAAAFDRLTAPLSLLAKV